MAKEVYIDRFGLDPDEIGGSPVKKTEFEYTKEYQNLRSVEPEEFLFEELEEDEKEKQTQENMREETKQREPEPQKPQKKKIESVSLDLSELIQINMKRQEEARQKEEQAYDEEEDIVHISLINNPTQLKVNIRNMSDKDIEFLESIRPLLEGKEVFKKFSTSSTISHTPFNPFDNKKPEKLGFGRRLLRLNPEDISNVFIVNKMNIRKNGYYIEKRGKLT
jgi:hypothetical protein